MKNISLCFSFFMLLNTGTTSAQNLVPNGNFDQVVECPSTLAALHNDCAHWYAGIQLPDEPWNNWPSPDWFHECSPFPQQLGVPSNLFGYQHPCDGGGYAGLYTYITYGTDYREIISSMLSEPMMVGLSYQVQLEVSRAEAHFSSRACDNLGVKFSTFSHWTSSEEAVNNFAHIFSNEVISEAAAWTTLQFDFIADSSYQYVHIGNFFVDGNTVSIPLEQNAENTLHCYYYIDCVEIKSETLNSGVMHNAIGKVTVYPNPSGSWIALEGMTTIRNYIIYNVDGRVVGQGNGQTVIDISHLSKGMYLVLVEDEKGKLSSSKFIKNP